MRTSGFSIFLVALLATCIATRVAALPAGRSWAPIENGPGPSLALTRGPDGTPELLVSPDFGPWGLSVWNENAWALPLIFPGSWSGSTWNVPLTLTDQRYFIWTGAMAPDGYYPMQMAAFAEQSFGVADTAFFATSQSSETSGAVSGSRRWVMRIEQYPPQPNIQFHVRTAYSDTPRVWHELPLLGINEFMGTMAPLGDRSAIVAWAGESGLAWAIADGDHWIRSGTIDSRPWAALHPRFRFRPSGGLWLMWPDHEWVHVSSFDGAQWSRGDSVRCPHNDAVTYASAWCDASRDGGERPVLVWNDLSYGIIRDVVVVAFPNATGWDAGEEIPGSFTGETPIPSITVDDLGDTWVAWWNVRRGDHFFTHTYVHSTATNLAVADENGHPRLSWSLSEAAPGSWWAVLSQIGGASEEVVARVQAGAGMAMSVLDDAADAQPRSYRIRRESTDARTRWHSEVVSWPPVTGVDPFSVAGRLTMRTLDGNPSRGAMRLAVEGAVPGRVRVDVFDLQGREVASVETQVAPSSSPVIVDLSAARRGDIPAGIYVVRAVDSRARSSSMRLVFLR